MKKLLSILAFVYVVLWFSLSALAQNLTTVSASNIQDINGAKLAAGQLCFLITDQNDIPLSVQIGGGGQALKRGYCTSVVNGAVTSFTVPNPANTQPAGIYYRITAKDTTAGQEVLRYTQVAFAGATFNFDNYAPTFPSFIAPMSNATVGNLTINGNLSVTGAMTFTPSSLLASNATINQAANGNDAIFSKRATDTSPTGNFERFRNFANSADLWTVDVTGTLQAGTIPTARLSGTTSGPFVSSSANPAATGILRVASGDTAVVFRNNANTADIVGISKNTSDVVSVGGSAGITTLGPVTLGATDAGLSRSAAASVAVGNGTAGDSSGTLMATTVSLPSTGLIKLGSSLGISNFGGQIAFGNGTVGSTSAPLQAGSAQLNFGSTNGADLGLGTPGVYTLGSNGVRGWTSGAANVSSDTGLSRTSAGVISVGNGSQGNVGGELRSTRIAAT